MLEPSLCSSFSIESKSRCFAEAMDCPFRVVHQQQVSSLQERPGGDRPTPRLSFSEQPIRFLGSSPPLSADSRCQKRFTATRIFRIGFCEARERSLGSGDITEQPCSACGIPLLSDSRTIGRRSSVAARNCHSRRGAMRYWWWSGYTRRPAASARSPRHNVAMKSAPIVSSIPLRWAS